MDKRKKMLMIAAITLAALMVLPFLVAAISALMPSAQAAVSQSDINKLKDKAKDIASEKADLNTELSKLKKEKASVVAQKAVYDQQIALRNDEIETKTALIEEFDADIAARNRALDIAIAEQADGKALFESRIAAMQRMGSTSYWGILLEAENFSDFLGRWDAMRRLIEYDNELAEEYRRTCEDIKTEREALEADRAEQVQCREDLTAAQVELAQLSAESDALIIEMNTDIANGQKELDAQEAAERAAQKEIAEAQAQWKKQQEEELERQRREREKNGQDTSKIPTTHEYVGGKYMWPVSGYTYISSYFGNRVHPVYGDVRFHTGIDIPAPKNTPILAANAGTVITRQYNAGYGNYIVVDHGGGQATLYGHLNGFGNYAVGSSVKRGDTIGYIGTTGISTGYHLHFEIIINGSQVNPVPYLKG